MLPAKLVKSLNEQIKYEAYSANLYLSMAAYCASLNLDGFTHFFKLQADEENLHAMKFFDFINERGGRVIISALDQPQSNFKSLTDTVSLALKHEQFVTKRIYGLMDQAIKANEHSMISFLKWFIDEQVEEEATFDTLLNKLKLVGEKGSGLFMLDAEVGQRTSTPAADGAE